MNENHIRVEAYLDQLLVPLSRNLSGFHRDELRRELRAHLWGRVDAYRELDYSEEDAVTEALRQFGGAKDFARQWRREWQRTPSKLTLREVYEAGKLVIRPTLLSLAGAVAPYGLLTAAFHRTYTSSLLRVLQINGTEFFWLLTDFVFFVLPLLMGFRQGKSSPAQAGVGILAALTAEIAAAALLYQGIDYVWPTWTIASSEVFTPLLCLLAAWLPLASGAAALSGWWARRTTARLLA